MVLWGGLRPIASRVILDSIAVVGLVYSVVTSVESKTSSPTKNNNNEKQATTRTYNYNGWVLVASLVLTVCTTGNTTNRWTLTFPMVPIFAFQALRRIQKVRRTKCVYYLIQALSIMCILIGIKLSILFPAVELPPIEGPFHVGTVDIHVPATLDQENCSSMFLPIRILYPTLEEPRWPKYLSPQIAFEYCRESMRFGAPEPLKDFDWMLHTWRLTASQTSHNARLAPSDTKFPIVMYSHGLGGNADIYSYQTLSLAAKGNVVVVMNHLDGSGPFVRTKSGQEVIFDYDIPKLEYQEQELVRRNQTDIRVRELVAATQALVRMNKGSKDDCDTNELVELGLSLENRLETSHISVMGHSFGGATAITAAKRNPDLFQAMVVHEPAIGWIPDDAISDFFALGKISDLEHAHTIQHRFDNETTCSEEENPVLHEIDSLVLYSDEWRGKGWGHCHLVEEMYKEGRLGPKDRVAHFGFIEGAHHNEFSDTSMLTPLWLARGVGLTGHRNPLETAKEIHERTVAFLNATRLRHGIPVHR